ncbi:hypothetical protein THSYN_11855 [Candidatus Thiodictyon syntrophicum]|uniref:Uncharacterized protein n=1 Tax=Candidatus Thiodictyon syntrophicum TaxID=1166950 RepID=A0A2K8U7M8_9GAMM|nr:hypothetical protein THSYN_11855 [Candidatus Thiodictyon syntrophicum]
MECPPNRGLLFPLALAVAPAVLAVSLTNGDFATGDFTGWPRDTDGGPGGRPGFSIVGPTGADAAQLQADYWSNPGNTAWERTRSKADSSARAWVSGTKYDSGENVSDVANAPCAPPRASRLSFPRESRGIPRGRSASPLATGRGAPALAPTQEPGSRHGST